MQQATHAAHEAQSAAEEAQYAAHQAQHDRQAAEQAKKTAVYEAAKSASADEIVQSAAVIIAKLLDEASQAARAVLARSKQQPNYESVSYASQVNTYVEMW